MNFPDWYKNMIESAEQEPPATVWEEIQNDLDLDKVWAGIDKELQGTRKRWTLYMIQAAASVLLLVGIGTYFLVNTGNGGMNELSIQTVGSEEALPPDNVSQQRPGAETVEIPALSYVQETPEFLLIQDDDNSGTIFAELHFKPEVVLKPLNPLSYNHSRQDYHLVKSKEADESGFENDMDNDRLRIELSGYYAGMSSHFGNTWLLNNKTLQGIKSDELTASLPSFGYSFGMIAGKKISRRFDIQAEAFFISRTSQNYNEYLHGQYVNNNLRFNYSSLTLSGRWNFITSELSGHHLLIFGAYAGLLRNASQDIAGQKFSLTNEYNSSDYGIVAGYEYLFPLGNQLALGTGFQTKYGLNNIFSGNEIIPDYLNSTRNASVNLILSIRYNLK